VNPRLELVQAHRRAPAVGFMVIWGGVTATQRSGIAELTLSCHGVDPQHSSPCMGEDACRQLRSWELLMKPTALPANYPGSPTGCVIKMGTVWV